MEEKKDEKLEKALLKVALGFQVAEVTEEYAEVDGQLRLTKRKKTKKDVPPDLKAVQILLSESGEGGFSTMSDEELIRERDRLIAGLQEEKTSGQVCVESKKKAKPKPRKRVVKKEK